MLVEFKFQNYKSFRDEQLLTMVAGPEKKLLENSFASPAMPGRLTRSAVVYGPNASGKSNLIDALAFVTRFVKQSADDAPDTAIPTQPFLFDKDFADKPSQFELTFIQAGVRYQYGFIADRRRVYEEWLLAYPKKKGQTWFERNWNEETQDYDYYFGPFLKGEKNKLASLTRPNALFLSVAARFNHERLSQVYRWFSSQVKIIDSETRLSLENAVSELMFNDNKLRQQLIELLRMADVGIVNFKVEKSPLAGMRSISSLLREQMSPYHPAAAGSRPADDRDYLISLSHQTADNDADHPPFLLDRESLGTRQLFGLGGSLLLALKRGQLVAIDELDASLHPMITRALVGLFNNPQTNPHNAQLVFNTHDTTLLDTTIFRRDQIWLTEKDRNGASHLYSVLEFKPRSDEALGKGYLQGRYGAIPILSNFEGLIANGADA
jgi:uncharacterized protein